MSETSTAGVHLRCTDDRSDAVEGLVDLLGGRVGVDGMLTGPDGLDRTARTTRVPGRAARGGLAWDAADQATRQWYPQGITSTADARGTGAPGFADHPGAGRDLLAVSWYSTRADGVHRGSRISVLDLGSRRYRHVLLVVPTRGADGSVRVMPLRVHAGGLVWCGPYLHVAATRKGLVTARVDDLVRVPEGRGDALGVFGYRYLLPVRWRYQAGYEEGHEPLRYSFLSLEHRPGAPRLVAGEYARAGQTRRLACFPLDPLTRLPTEDDDGRVRPVRLTGDGVRQMQGVAVVDGTWYVSSSRGRSARGSLYVGEPGGFRERARVLPPGPEDLTHWPARDELWTATEHPGKRYVCRVPRVRLG